MLLKTRRNMLSDCYKNFDHAQNLLEQWFPEEAKSRDEVELQYVEGLAMFDKAIAKKRTIMESRGGSDLVRLPAVDLPSFSGENENWLEWFDKFNALIHRRTTLQTIQKFEYLKLSLRGTASGLVDSLPTTEANYAIAYDLLVNRYNNPKLLIHKHMRDLFELEPVQAESAESLRNLFDAARKNLRCLQILKQPVESWDAVLLYQMANKLDPVTRREWESAASGTEPPTYQQLETFVLGRCQMLDAMPVKRKTTPETNLTKRPKLETRSFTASETPRRQRCPACDKEHFIGHCHRFGEKSLDEKVKMIKRYQLCFNCLKPKHTAEQCHSRECIKCGRKHHTSIHREPKPDMSLGRTRYNNSE